MDWEMGEAKAMQAYFNIYAAYCSILLQVDLQARFCINIYALAFRSAATSSSILERTLSVSE